MKLYLPQMTKIKKGYFLENISTNIHYIKSRLLSNSLHYFHYLSPQYTFGKLKVTSVQEVQCRKLLAKINLSQFVATSPLEISPLKKQACTAV